MDKYNIFLCFCKRNAKDFIRFFLIFDIIVSILSIYNLLSIISLIISCIWLQKIKKTNTYKHDLLKCFGIFKLITAIIGIIVLAIIFGVFGLSLFGIKQTKETNAYLVIWAILIPIVILVIIYTQILINFYKATKSIFNDLENLDLEIAEQSNIDLNIKNDPSANNINYPTYVNTFDNNKK